MQKIHRFFTSYKQDGENIIISNKDTVFQIKKVLKLRPGEKIILVNDGEDALMTILTLGATIEGKLEKIEANKNEPITKVILYCSILKKENFELVAQKATEIGVYKIVPIVSQRTVKLNLNFDRLQKILKEAAEQSGRAIIPELGKVMTFVEALNHSKNNDLNILFDPSGEDLKNSKLPEKIGLFIGPEGGWGDEEIAEAKLQNFKIENLGKLILRGETAAIVATYTLCSQCLSVSTSN